MSTQTLISWADHTWNPWRGCTRVSSGCANCYMFAAQRRWGRDPSVVTRTTKSVWDTPRKWQRDARAAGQTRRVFACSWSDWFHADADSWRPEAWERIKSTPDLIYMILTKRADRIADHLPPSWGDGWPNVWLGVTCEDQSQSHRVESLSRVPAVVRFVSYEPAIGPLSLDLQRLGVSWVIYGGESGPGYRPEGEPGDPKQWARSMRDQCHAAGVAYFHKQSAATHTERGVELDGEIYHELPVIA